MTPEPPANGQKKTAAWAIGAATASLITGWAGAVQVIQEPLERDIAALNRRLDEALLSSSEARNALRDQIAAATKDNLLRGDERLAAMAERQAQTNININVMLSEIVARIDRIEQDRARLIESVTPKLARMEDHVASVDARLVEIEKIFTRVLRDVRSRDGNSAR